MIHVATVAPRTPPTVAARFARLVCFLAKTAVPIIAFTVLAVRQMPFFAFFTEPSIVARFVRSVRFFTAGAEPHFQGVVTLLRLAIRHASGMLRSARRATPGIFIKRIFGGMNRVARFARPTPFFAGHQQLILLPPPFIRHVDLARIATPVRLPNAEFVPLPVITGFFRTNRILV